MSAEPARRVRRRWLAIAMAALALGPVTVLVGCSNYAGLKSAATNSVAQPDGAGPVTVSNDLRATADSQPAATSTGAVPSIGWQRDAVPSPLGPLPGGQLTEDTTPWPAPPADPTGPVARAVAAAAASGVLESVVVLDRATGAVLTQVDQDAEFPALSLVKLMIAADVVTGGANGGPAGGDPASSDPAGGDPASSDPAGGDPASSAPAGGDPASSAPAGSDPASSAPTSSDPASSGSTSGDPTSADPAGGDPAISDRTRRVSPGLHPSTLAQLREMIARSDDVTASDLYEAGGGDELIERVAARFGLTGTTPTPDGQYWGNVQTTAADMASLLAQSLADPVIGPVIGPDMLVTTATAQDGVDQRIGMRTVPGAGSKQGWGCCLSGVVGIHSVGFTSSRIVVVLSSAEPDDDSLGAQDGLALQADPGAQVSIAAVTDTVRAALGAPGQ